jgi:hypothetical protein
MVKLITVCGVTATPFPLAGHAMRFWRRHGVDQIAVVLHRPPRSDPGVAEPFRKVFLEYGASVHDWVDTFNSFKKTDQMREVLKTALVPRPEDWILVSDMDEFPDFLGFTAKDYLRSLPPPIDAVHGHLLDHVAPGGLLPVMTDGNLADQYPLVSYATATWGCIDKVVAVRNGIEWTHGHHLILKDGVMYGLSSPWSSKLSLQVHHFKWDATVVDRLWERGKVHRRDKAGIPHWREAIFEWMHIRKNGGITLSALPDTSGIRKFL